MAKVVERTRAVDAGSRRHPWSLRVDGLGMKRPVAHDGRRTSRWRRCLRRGPHRSETFKLSAAIRWLRGQGPRHHRPLSVAAGPRAGALCRREEPRSRHLVAHSRSCRCCRACLSAAHTTTSVTARPRCSQPSMSRRPRHRQVLQAPPGQGPRLPERDRRASPRGWTSTSSWTTTPPTRRRRSRRGWHHVCALMSTSRRLRRPGSIRSNAGSP